MPDRVSPDCTTYWARKDPAINTRNITKIRQCRISPVSDSEDFATLVNPCLDERPRSSQRPCMRIVFQTLCLLAVIGTPLQSADKPFAKVTDDPKLPRVLLIGDSISIGYTVQTRALLKGKANVHRVPTNAGDTGRGINGLPKWLKTLDGKWDVIHFNWGLWDLCYRNPKSRNQGRRDKVNGKLTHTIKQYTDNLEKLVTALQKTRAELIFATTTPVPEGELGRKLGDDLKYNAAATKLMRKHGIAINDLHAVMAGKMKKYGVKPGDVHFTRQGSELLAKQVAKAISAALEAD